jgi:hypothetical protein
MASLIRAALVVLPLLVACAALAPQGQSPPPRALADADTVAVSWDDPAAFTERSRRLGSGAASVPEDWIEQLAHHLRRSIAARLPEGSYEDIGRAVDRDVRVLRDIYPPLLDLRLRRLAADGSELEAGEHRLRDPGYLSRGAGRSRRDTLFFEQRMIDEWAARLWPSPRP